MKLLMAAQLFYCSLLFLWAKLTCATPFGQFGVFRANNEFCMCDSWRKLGGLYQGYETEMQRLVRSQPVMMKGAEFLEYLRKNQFPATEREFKAARVILQAPIKKRSEMEQLQCNKDKYRIQIRKADQYAMIRMETDIQSLGCRDGTSRFVSKNVSDYRLAPEKYYIYEFFHFYDAAAKSMEVFNKLIWEMKDIGVLLAEDGVYVVLGYICDQGRFPDQGSLRSITKLDEAAITKLDEAELPADLRAILLPYRGQKNESPFSIEDSM
eukprot:Lankesteria_metandrocarpae@DN4595_c0_g1_i2.p1